MLYIFSVGIISPRASYRGRRYGSTLSFISPGKKPRLSPASTAGLHSIIFLTSLFFKAFTAKSYCGVGLSCTRWTYGKIPGHFD